MNEKINKELYVLAAKFARLYESYLEETDDWRKAWTAAKEKFAASAVPEVSKEAYDLFMSKYVADGSENIRRCSECGRPMNKGWMSDDGGWHGCSEKCLVDSYKTYDNPEQAMQEDLDHEDVFYTEWDDEEYFYL